MLWSFEEKGKLGGALAKIIIDIFLLSNSIGSKEEDNCLDSQIKKINDIYNNYVASEQDRKRLNFLIKIIKKLNKPTTDLITIVLKFVDFTNIKNLKDFLYNDEGTLNSFIFQMKIWFD